MESHFERRFEVLHFEVQEPRRGPRSVWSSVFKQSTATVCAARPSGRRIVGPTLSNTVSQVLARPSEWLELFKASRQRDAFFFACFSPVGEA